MDGLPHNPRQAKHAVNKATAVMTGTAAQQQQQQQWAPKAAAAAAQTMPDKLAGLQQSAATAAAAAVSSLTARELVALRSALPSPKKHKGAKLAEELGIKPGEAVLLDYYHTSLLGCQLFGWWTGSWLVLAELCWAASVTRCMLYLTTWLPVVVAGVEHKQCEIAISQSLVSLNEKCESVVMTRLPATAHVSAGREISAATTCCLQALMAAACWRFPASGWWRGMELQPGEGPGGGGGLALVCRRNGWTFNSGSCDKQRHWLAGWLLVVGQAFNKMMPAAKHLKQQARAPAYMPCECTRGPLLPGLTLIAAS
jgi:hypothetical protein